MVIRTTSAIDGCTGGWVGRSEGAHRLGPDNSVGYAAADPLDAGEWLDFADHVYGSQTPLNAALAHCVAADSDLLRLVNRFPAHPRQPLIVLAAVQYLVMGGAAHPIAELYKKPLAPPPLPIAGELLSDFCRAFEPQLREVIGRRFIQTNEPARASALGIGIALAAASIGEPVALIDAGASGGLNLAFDRYHLDFGNAGSLGSLGSPARLRCTIRNRSRLPVDRLPSVTRRLGIDRAPLDLRDEPSRRWLLALAWPGTERQSTLRKVIDLVLADPPVVRRGDMVTDLEAALAEMRPDPTVVVTSWSFSYLRPAARARFEAILAAAGRDRPVAWVCCDNVGTADRFTSPVPPPRDQPVASVMGVAVFDRDRVDTRVLAYVDAYGSWIDWIEMASPC
jgi:hypothetical protein